MKLSSEKETADRLEVRLLNLSSQFNEYQPGDIESLSKMSKTIVMAKEYWVDSLKNSVLYLEHQNEIEEWLKNIYMDQIVLVLKHEDCGLFGYTRNFIMKAMRGFRVHSDQKDRKDKDKVLRQFLHELDEETKVTYEFALTLQWLFTGGIHASTGNTDSRSPFRHKFILSPTDIRFLSTLESIILNIILEFLTVWQKGTFPETDRIVLAAKKTELIERFGEELGSRCYQTVEWHQTQK